MDRQLKRAAFFGTDAQTVVPWGATTNSPGGQTPSPDVNRRVVVGGVSEPAADTLESISGRTVLLVDQTATCALARRVARIDKQNRNPRARCLVADQGAQCVKAPVVQSRPLAPRGLSPVPDAFEVFEGDRGPVAFGGGNDCFGNHVAGVALKPRLLAGRTAQRPLRRSGANLLQSPAPVVMPAADALNLFASEDAALIVHGEIDDAEVNAAHVNRGEGRHIVHVACRGEHPLFAHEHQVHLAFGADKQFTLPGTADEGDALPPRKRPDRDGILAGQKAEDAFVVWLRGVPAEASGGGLVASLEGIRDLSDAADRGLSRQPEAGAHLGVADAVQIVLPGQLGVGADAGKPAARRVAPLQGLPKRGSLLGRRKKANGCNEFHAGKYMRNGTIKQERRAGARPAIPPSPEGDGLSRRIR